MKKLILAVATSIIFLSGCTSSFEREMKSWDSEMNGGLNRVITVYDYNGDVIKTYEGKIDIETSTSNDKVLFDLNGKRNIIFGGIVTIEEVDE